MAITTFAELKTTIGDFLNRSDVGTTSENWIALAEADMNRDLRHWRMENRSVATVDGRFTPLPTDWLETISVHLQDSGTRHLEHLSRVEMARLREANEDAGGNPRYFAHTEGSIELYPSPSSGLDLEMLYIQKVPALSDSNTSNWVLSNAPDAYLYGSLTHAIGYYRDETNARIWPAQYQQAIQRLNAESDRAAISRTGAKIRLGLS
jgi:hypothetical protein